MNTGRPRSVSLYFLPVETRVPLKFGPETVTRVTCVRVRMEIEGPQWTRASGWGETPLSVQWVWPSTLPYSERAEVLERLCRSLACAWADWDRAGHPIEVGYAFQEEVLPGLLQAANRERGATAEPIPWLAALVCCSAFDLALHDAYGRLMGLPVFECYQPQYMQRDLSAYLTPARGGGSWLHRTLSARLSGSSASAQTAGLASGGGLDPLEDSDLNGSEPDDGYPVTLREWIAQDGLRCLKVKLRGNDYEWDYQRLVQVGEIGVSGGAVWPSADFNCTVTDPAYVNEILDRLVAEQPRIYGMVLYVEQPFPYDLEQHRIDVHSVSARKPLFMDESAHDWRLVRLGRSLGWTGVALKTCKTLTGALLSLCWAQAHGMTLMVQDLTNPMLAQVPHVLLAAHAGTIMVVESNAMQFYPQASLPEAAVHPGLYQRRDGRLDLTSLRGPGFGYRVEEIERTLPAPAIECIR